MIKDAYQTGPPFSVSASQSPTQELPPFGTRQPLTLRYVNVRDTVETDAGADQTRSCPKDRS